MVTVTSRALFALLDAATLFVPICAESERSDIGPGRTAMAAERQAYADDTARRKRCIAIDAFTVVPCSLLKPSLSPAQANDW
jgi:hypothetical protein